MDMKKDKCPTCGEDIVDEYVYAPIDGSPLRCEKCKNRKDKNMNKDEKRTVVNTESEHGQLVVFLASIVTGNSDFAIRAQEKQGQQQLVNSDVLPTEVRDCHLGGYGLDAKVVDSRKTLEKFGVKFLGIVENDPLFQYVELPKGWRKESSDHDMLSYLIDDKGRKRASVFYKAAFYDRHAMMHLKTRFSFRQDYDLLEKEGICVARVFDGNDVMYSTDPVKKTGDNQEWYEHEDKICKIAKDWLNEHYPDWRDPGAYWD